MRLVICYSLTNAKLITRSCSACCQCWQTNAKLTRVPTFSALKRCGNIYFEVCLLLCFRLRYVVLASLCCLLLWVAMVCACLRPFVGLLRSLLVCSQRLSVAVVPCLDIADAFGSSRFESMAHALSCRCLPPSCSCSVLHGSDQDRGLRIARRQRGCQHPKHGGPSVLSLLVSTAGADRRLTAVNRCHLPRPPRLVCALGGI